MGAGGAYIATRSDDAPAVTAARRRRSAPISPDSPTQRAVGVEQSEAIVTESPPSPRSAGRGAQAARRAAGRAASASPAAAEAAERPPVVDEAPLACARPGRNAGRDSARHRTGARRRTPEPEPVRPVEPPAPKFEELVVSADSVVGLQVETALTSERARVEDEVVAHVTRDVRVGDRVAIPSGAKAVGEVTLVERGGRLRDRARLGIRFTSIVLADGTRVPIETETIFREGDSPSGESAAKIGGGAIGGAIIGGILGGAKGAILGGTAGAGAGSAAVLAGGRNPATLPSGTPVTVRVLKPVTVEVEK